MFKPLSATLKTVAVACLGALAWGPAAAGVVSGQNSAVLLLLVVALIVYGSLYPWSLDFDRSGANPLWVLLHAWPREINRWMLCDTAINLLLYFPLGMAAFLAAARRHGRWVSFGVALLIALGLSASMEMLQIYDPGRTCSLFDVFCNVSGAAAGPLMMI